MTTPAFPSPIFEGYVYHGRHGWTPVEGSFTEDLGVCMCAVADEIGRDWPMAWRIKRTDFDPDTGEVECSFFVDEREARKAGTLHCEFMDEEAPDWMSGRIAGPDPADEAYDRWVEAAE